MIRADVVPTIITRFSHCLIPALSTEVPGESLYPPAVGANPSVESPKFKQPAIKTTLQLPVVVAANLWESVRRGKEKARASLILHGASWLRRDALGPLHRLQTALRTPARTGRARGRHNPAYAGRVRSPQLRRNCQRASLATECQDSHLPPSLTTPRFDRQTTSSADSRLRTAPAGRQSRQSRG